MKAQSLTIQEFLSKHNIRFIIPVYQRNYDWAREQCAQLIHDILKAGADGGSAHFIGSIVYIQNNLLCTTSETRDLVIIDGQQRLITLMLIYIALYRLTAQIDPGRAESIRTTYVMNTYPAAELKLKPTENNANAFQFLWDNDPLAKYPEFSNVIENFNAVASRIHKGNYQQAVQGLSNLLFVEIVLERGRDDPQRIFESLNSTGLKLSQADLIRNYILMNLEYDEQQRVYHTYWDFIEKHACCTGSNESRVSDFIRDYLTLENKKIPNKENVYTEFKIKYPSLTDLDTALKPIKQFASHYGKLINPEREPDKEIREEIASVNQLESTVVYPFLLQIYDDYANTVIEKPVFIAILNLIQSFVWRRFITGLPTSALNKIFMNLYDKIDKTDYVNSIARALVQQSRSERFPNNEEVIGALHFKDMYNTKAKKLRYALGKLEHHDNTEKVMLDTPAITIEHIFPQKPDKIWEEELGKEEYALMKEKYVHTISNLTLSGNNGKLGNKSFQEKKHLKDAGYKDSRLWLNTYLASIETWNIAALEQRFNIIKARFLEIWAYPRVRCDEVPATEEVTLSEAGDPTGRTFEYVIFRDEKKIISTVTDLYREVVKQLFDCKPEMFFTTGLADSLSFTTNKDALRRPLEITDTWFIESGINNKDKFKKIKQAVTIFGLEDDEVIIKYRAREDT
jgi:uncharacterized protein with ParB-like and HNH nuclease domain